MSLLGKSVSVCVRVCGCAHVPHTIHMCCLSLPVCVCVRVCVCILQKCHFHTQLYCAGIRVANRKHFKQKSIQTDCCANTLRMLCEYSANAACRLPSLGGWASKKKRIKKEGGSSRRRKIIAKKFSDSNGRRTKWLPERNK